MKIRNLEDLESFIELIITVIPVDQIPRMLVLEDSSYDAISCSKSSKDVSSYKDYVFRTPFCDLKIVSRYQYEFERAVNRRLIKRASEQKFQEIIQKKKEEDPYWGL